MPQRVACHLRLHREATAFSSASAVGRVAGLFDGWRAGNRGFCAGGSTRPALAGAALGLVTPSGVHRSIFRILDRNSGVQRAYQRAGYVGV